MVANAYSEIILGNFYRHLAIFSGHAAYNIKDVKSPGLVVMGAISNQNSNNLTILLLQRTLTVEGKITVRLANSLTRLD